MAPAGREDGEASCAPGKPSLSVAATTEQQTDIDIKHSSAPPWRTGDGMKMKMSKTDRPHEQNDNGCNNGADGTPPYHQ